MEWMEAIGEAIDYIEAHITEEITLNDIAEQVHISPFYFHKGFSMLCGYSLKEYIRNRRLSLAGGELVSGAATVTELAMKYGYDSPDSFTKAFARFHGSTPTQIRKGGASLKSFAPLHIRLSLEGGSVMEYRIQEKKAFKVMGLSKMFSYESANADIPKYWNEIRYCPEGKALMGRYGICFDAEMAGDRFRYMIADDYQEEGAENLEEAKIPAHTWAVFSCRGPMPSALQEVNRQIFAQWLPASRYEIAEGYNIECYNDAANYEGGIRDAAYEAEIWLPVKESVGRV